MLQVPQLVRPVAAAYLAYLQVVEACPLEAQATQLEERRRQGASACLLAAKAFQMAGEAFLEVVKASLVCLIRDQGESARKQRLVRTQSRRTEVRALITIEETGQHADKIKKDSSRSVNALPGLSMEETGQPNAAYT